MLFRGSEFSTVSLLPVHNQNHRIIPLNFRDNKSRNIIYFIYFRPLLILNSIAVLERSIHFFNFGFILPILHILWQFFLQKWLYLSKIPFLAKSSFIKSVRPIKKGSPIPFHNKTIYAVVTISHARSAGTGKCNKILKNGARSN